MRGMRRLCREEYKMINEDARTKCGTTMREAQYNNAGSQVLWINGYWERRKRALRNHKRVEPTSIASTCYTIIDQS